MHTDDSVPQEPALVGMERLVRRDDEQAAPGVGVQPAPMGEPEVVIKGAPVAFVVEDPGAAVVMTPKWECIERIKPAWGQRYSMVASPSLSR